MLSFKYFAVSEARLKPHTYDGIVASNLKRLVGP